MMAPKQGAGMTRLLQLGLLSRVAPFSDDEITDQAICMQRSKIREHRSRVNPGFHFNSSKLLTPNNRSFNVAYYVEWDDLIRYSARWIVCLTFLIICIFSLPVYSLTKVEQYEACKLNRSSLCDIGYGARVCSQLL